MERWFLGLAGLLGAIAVAAGAFGAHVLEGKLTDRALETFATAARYQLTHALLLALVAIVLWIYPADPAPTTLGVAGWAIVVGMVLFCGSLYGLSFGAPKILGAIAPLGGLGFMLGWLSLGLTAWQWPKP